MSSQDTNEKQQRAVKRAPAESGKPAQARHILRAPLASTPPVNAGSHSPLSLGARAAITSQQRFAMIASAAYLRAEAHGFSAGHELDDWLSAEKEVDLLLASGELPEPNSFS